MDLLFMLVFLAFIICGVVVDMAVTRCLRLTTAFDRMALGICETAQTLGVWTAGLGAVPQPTPRTYPYLATK